MSERWCYELTMPTGTAVTYDIMRATNSVGATVEGNAANDPYGDEGWPDCEFIASVWAENDPEGTARLIASAPDLLSALKRMCADGEWITVEGKMRWCVSSSALECGGVAWTKAETHDPEDDAGSPAASEEA